MTHDQSPGLPEIGAAVRQLLQASVIDQVKVGRRNRAFEAAGLLEAFTGFARMPQVPTTVPHSLGEEVTA